MTEESLDLALQPSGHVKKTALPQQERAARRDGRRQLEYPRSPRVEGYEIHGAYLEQ